MVALLYERGGAWQLPFVRRRADLRDHPGQVALPGGRVQAGEDAWAAAAREAVEELGPAASGLHPLGAGAAFYASVTNFSVVPFVAWLPEAPAAFEPDAAELAGVFEIPLLRLLDEAAWLTSEEPWRFRYFSWEESVVWGLTERILADLLPRFSSALAASGPRPGPPAASG